MQMPNGIIAKSAQHVFHIVPDDVIVFITRVNYIHFDFPCEKKTKKNGKQFMNRRNMRLRCDIRK